ncbi:hypothetical protein L195_g047304 [Trifolium pratense]|uniref:Uncharacterized protein n=1 Tax=Trifolium pratense TaxID=57577 RepID=A0A2K3MK84_TRIPR|nr:hypothetical protein L195_g047304 [Trifolium pratense]
MAIIETNIKGSLHLRSNSLPSTPHPPLISQFEDNLQRLKSSEGTSPLSSSSVSNKLNGIQDLQDCIDNLLQLPIEQQTLAQECNEKCVDDLLESNPSPMLGFLKEAEAVTLCSLEHLLLFISDPKGHSKHRGWSSISKLMHFKRAVCDSHESETNDGCSFAVVIYRIFSKSYGKFGDVYSRSRNRS